MPSAKTTVFVELKLAFNRFSVFERIARDVLALLARHANKIVLAHKYRCIVTSLRSCVVKIIFLRYATTSP